MFDKTKPSAPKSPAPSPIKGAQPSVTPLTPVQRILQLQKTVGNRAVTQMMEKGSVAGADVLQAMMKRKTQKDDDRKDEEKGSNNNNNASSSTTTTTVSKPGIQDQDLIYLLENATDYPIDALYEQLALATPEQLQKFVTGKRKKTLQQAMDQAELDLGFEGLQIKDVSEDTVLAGKELITLLHRINNANKGSGESLDTLLIVLTDFLGSKAKSLEGLSIAGKSVSEYLDGLISGKDECNNVLTSKAIPDLELAIKGTPKVLALRKLLEQAGVKIK